MFVSNPTLVIQGEKSSDAFTRQKMQLTSHDEVAEIWEKDFGATSTSILVYPPYSVANMMAIADRYQYGFPQQRILEFFKGKALKLEVKLRHREGELTAAEALIAAKDEEILELKNRLKGKERLGAEEEKLLNELALVRSDLEKARNDTSSSKGLFSYLFFSSSLPFVFLMCCLSLPSLSLSIDIRELTWLQNEKTLQASRIRELVEKIKDEADKLNAREDEHNELMAQYRQRREQMVDMQNRYNSDRRQFDGALLWTRENLREAREGIYRLETKVASLEEELRQARSSHDPEARDYIQWLVRERDDARAEAHALSNALSASRADVARLVESEKDLEINMDGLTKGIEEMSNEVNHLRHLYSMKQVELDEYLEGQLNLANERLEKAQSSLAYQEGQAKYFEGLAGSRDAAAKESAKKVARLTSLLSQFELKATVITHKARCQLAEEINKTLTKIEQNLLKEHDIVKKYPRRPMPEPLTYSSGPFSGGSVPLSQPKNPADRVESSKRK
ncbi:uncharacterized protein LOC113324322 [Papaver somniferum]|uniref:uncharacterized protein LOC113324322 n=1 Tax=Papaver somniferum TaxID=3469 RepID=UPI000E6FE9FE|nr:uncharacterized protein LOC113324322 [Papaver somniferum]